MKSLTNYYYCYYYYYYFFYLGFLSRTFTIHRTVGEGGGHLFNSSPSLPLASQTISRAITGESSPLNISCSQTRTGNLWFSSASRKPMKILTDFQVCIGVPLITKHGKAMKSKQEQEQNISDRLICFTHFVLAFKSKSI